MKNRNSEPVTQSKRKKEKPITPRKRIKYHRIYKQLYKEPPAILASITKETGIAKSTAARYLQEMYEGSILKGPMLFIKHAQNFHEYVYVLNINDCDSVYKKIGGFPYVTSVSLDSGAWNLLLTTEKQMDFSLLNGFDKCIFQGIKGKTILSEVVTLSWDESLRTIKDSLFQPEQKTTLYEETLENPWEEWEWKLYYEFKDNIRKSASPIYGNCGIRHWRYAKWWSTIHEFCSMYPAFYPYGMDSYFGFDFLFDSEYHEQLAGILGLLPATCEFFSVGRYLYARLFILNINEKNSLFDLIFQLKHKGFFTDFYQAMLISTANYNQYLPHHPHSPPGENSGRS